MKACKWTTAIAILVTLLTLQGGSVFAAGAASRPGKLVTIEGREISFFRLDGRSTIKGWLNGIAIEVPMDTVSQIVFFDAPNSSYSMFGNNISSGNIEVTRRADGKKFLLTDAFLPSDCDCTYVTYSYRNPFTDEMSQANAALDGLRRILFFDEQ